MHRPQTDPSSNHKIRFDAFIETDCSWRAVAGKPGTFGAESINEGGKLCLRPPQITRVFGRFDGDGPGGGAQSDFVGSQRFFH